MNNIVVRRANAADMDALIILFDHYRQFYGRTSEPEAARDFLLNRLSRDDSILFMAWVNNSAAGFVQLYPSFSSVMLAPTLVLNDLYVMRDSRRRGIASLLLAAAVEFAKSAGVVRLTLSTAIDNIDAQALYETRGWELDRQFLVYHMRLST